jgi:geranylgeranyl pyrophosphate synthase
VNKLEAKVIYNGYEDVISSKHPRVVARILSILADSKSSEDPNVERIAELEEKLEKAESAQSSAEYYRKQAVNKLKEIEEKAS